MTDELVINEDNFTEYFHDVRTSKPQAGQVMARYAAVADFIDGRLKRDVMEILMHHDARSLPKVMRKMGCAVEKDAYHVLLEIAQDMLNGMGVEDVAKKPYRYTMEVFFYTRRECVPTDDPHWSIITLLNLDEYLDREQNRVTISTREVPPDEISVEESPDHI